MILQDDPHRQIVRIGDTVRRPVYPWSASVHLLLQHLSDVGFPYSPRFLGIDEENREVLTYLEGDSGPNGWAKVVDPAGLVAMAELLRDYHAAVRSYRPGGIGLDEVICHGDFGPWNLVWQGTRPVGILDWDHARAAPARHDVAYALEYVTPFRDDDTCLRWLRYPSPPDRPGRLARFAHAYGLTSTDGLVDEVLHQQRTVAARTRRLAAEGHQPQAEWLRTGVLDETDARIRWSDGHRHLFG